MKIKYILFALSFSFSISLKGQDILNKASIDACDCISKLPYDSSAVIPNDSINKCIAQSMGENFQALLANKKLKMGTVEGIMEFMNKIMADLRKKCPRLQTEPAKIDRK